MCGRLGGGGRNLKGDANLGHQNSGCFLLVHFSGPPYQNAGGIEALNNLRLRLREDDHGAGSGHHVSGPLGAYVARGPSVP